VKRITKKAAIVVASTPIHRKARTMMCGMISAHLTSQSQRLSPGSSVAFRATGVSLSTGTS
jgi:hypothetical protein